MFRVVSYQAVLRILFLCAGLMVVGAVAQDQPDKAADKPANAATAAPTAAQTEPAQAKPASDAVDPLTRPNTEKQKKKNQRALKQELSNPYKKWLEEDVCRKNHTSRLPTPTSTSRQASRGGKPIADACTSSSASPMKSIPILRADPTSGPWKRAAERLRPSRLKTSAIAISRASARK